MCIENPLEGLETFGILLGRIQLSENHFIHLQVNQLISLHFAMLFGQHLQSDRRQDVLQLAEALGPSARL